MRASKPRVAVIGAGIVGASIAYHLALRGGAVTIIDRAGPATGVTRHSFAWINIAHGQPGPYRRLRHQAIADWRRLERELAPALSVEWCGALTWTADSERTEQFARDHAAHGYDMRLVERAEIARLEPNLVEPPAVAAFAAGEGAVDPVAATKALVLAAQRAGAEYEISDVVDIATDGARIIGLKTAAGIVPCDVIVLAAGTGSKALAGRVGIALSVEESRAVLVRFRTPNRLVNRIISNPQMEIRHGADGHLWCAEDWIDETLANNPQAIAQRTMAVIKGALRESDGLALESVDVGIRPIPADDLPILGYVSRLRGLYVAVMHAGVILAPVMGRLVANEILDGARENLISACRPDRFSA